MQHLLKRVTLGRGARTEAGAEVRVVDDAVTLYPSGPREFVNLDFAFDLEKGALVCGDVWERSYKDLSWRAAWPDLPAMPWYACFSWAGGAEFAAFGVETGANALAAWQIIGGGIRLILDVRSGSEPVMLKEPLELCRLVYLRENTDSAFTSMRKFCRMMCPSPRLPEGPVFGGNNWYYAYGITDARAVLGDAARVARWTKGLPVRPYMMVDVGWQPFLLNGDICAGGPYPHGNYRFPDLPGLTKRMLDMGVRPALWFRPLLSCESLPEGEYFKKGVLDPTVDAVCERIAQDAARIASWGFEMLKHDFTTYDLTGMFGMHPGMQGILEYPEAVRFRDNSLTTAQAMKRVYAAVRNGAGEKPVMSCNAVGHLTAGLSEIQRIGDDTSGREWDRTRDYGVNALGFRIAQHNALFAADPDCVGITEKIDWRLNRNFLDLVARSGTPLFVAADPAALTGEMEDTIMEAFARAAHPPRRAEPVDWMETNVPRAWRFDGEEFSYRWE